MKQAMNMEENDVLTDDNQRTRNHCVFEKLKVNSYFR